MPQNIKKLKKKEITLDDLATMIQHQFNENEKNAQKRFEQQDKKTAAGFKEVAQRFKGVEQNFWEMNQKLNEIEEDAKEIKEKVNDIHRLKFQELEKRIVILEELKKRVKLLEAKNR